MAKDSALYQLMGVRMNGIMNDITNSDGEYQEIIRKSEVYCLSFFVNSTSLREIICSPAIHKNRPCSPICQSAGNRGCLLILCGVLGM